MRPIIHTCRYIKKLSKTSFEQKTKTKIKASKLEFKVKKVSELLLGVIYI